MFLFVNTRDMELNEALADVGELKIVIADELKKGGFTDVIPTIRLRSPGTGMVSGSCRVTPVHRRAALLPAGHGGRRRRRSHKGCSR